ncbi:MAG: hypothetical protein R2852_03320 [Bacteroidia bacterium]
MKTTYKFYFYAFAVSVFSFACNTVSDNSIANIKKTESANSMSGLLELNDLGAWALYQHNSISTATFNLFNTKKISPLDADGKAMDFETASKYFEEEYVAFISTDPNDPSVGYDTTIKGTRTENFYGFTLQDKLIAVSPIKGKKLYFNKSEFMDALSDGLSSYLNNYSENGEVEFRNIPLKTHQLLQSINMDLVKESRLETSELYKTDTLINLFSKEDKKSRGNAENPVFISTDPDDPTQGYDSVYTTNLEESMKDSGSFQGIFYSLKGDMSNIQLSGISCGFSPYVFGVHIPYAQPFGFLKYKSVKFLSEDQRKMLESAFLFSLRNKINPRLGDIDYYMERFQIKK